MLCCIILMGQTPSQSFQSRPHSFQNWLCLDKDPNVFTNTLTHEQAQRHFIRILVKDLPRETALFSTRMNNHQPCICRLLYFHLLSHQPRHPHDHEKDFREMFVYTDRMLPLKDWGRERVLLALQGLRRLVSVHGPIRITEHMVGENQAGEIKVWISENAVNNHPDSKYMSEEQSMGDFAALLTRKNLSLANMLIGCITLKEASERLGRLQRDENSPYQNYSHRASGSGDIVKKKEKEKAILAPYKNVFGDINDSVKTKPEPTTPKHSIKMFEHYPMSSFLPKEEEQITPNSQSATLSRYRQFVYTNKSGTPNEEKILNKSNPKNIHTNSQAYLLGNRKEEEGKVNFRPSKINDNSTDAQKGKEFLSFTNSNVKSHEPAKPFSFMHRFETATNLSPNFNHFNSPKSRADQGWRSNESSNLNISNIYGQRQEAKPFKEERIKGNGYDITIINNNVNNYISNITHNHILKVDKSSEQLHQFRTQTKMEEQTGSSIHSSNQFPKYPQKKEKQYNIPVFIQQKKKTTDQPPVEPFISKSKSNNNLARKYTVSSNPQQLSFDSPQISSEKKVEGSFEVSSKERKQKVFNFKQDPMISSHKTNPVSYPMSPTHQQFASFQRAGNNSFEFKAPLRTKTTQFYQKNRDTSKKDELQNKSFTQNEVDRRDIKDREEVPEKKLLRQESACATTTTNFSSDEPRPEENKIQFKKQLRNEFKFLLSADPKEKQEQPRPPQKTQKQQVKQGNLKDKIMRKQIVFAELKKQAFELLQ